MNLLFENTSQFMGRMTKPDGTPLFEPNQLRLFASGISDIPKPKQTMILHDYWDSHHPYLFRGMLQMESCRFEDYTQLFYGSLRTAPSSSNHLCPTEVPGFYKSLCGELVWEAPYIDRVVKELERFFTYVGFPLTDVHRNIIRECIKGNQRSFYKVYEIKKKSGGTRTIEAPCPELKAMQQVLLKRLLVPVWKSHPFAFGFVPHKSIVNCAASANRSPLSLRDSNRRYLLKVDLKDFFPSITEGQVLSQLLKQFGRRFRNYANWCWYPDIVEQSGMLKEKITNWARFERHLVRQRGLFKRGEYSVNLNRMHKKDLSDIGLQNTLLVTALQRFLHLTLGMVSLAMIDARLPQGSPLSPYLSNIAMYPYDVMIHSDAPYAVRYADDIALVSPNVQQLGAFERKLEVKLLRDGYVVNRNKVHIIRHGKPMRIVGLNINSGTPSFSRYKRKNVEAMMHNIISGKHEKALATINKIRGYRALFKMSGQWTDYYEAMYRRITA